MNYVLTEDDRQIIANLVAENMQRRINAPLREQETFQHGSPEVYVCKLPDGIAARDGDEPGMEEDVEVFKMTQSGSDPWVLEPALYSVGNPVTRTVFNISDSAFAGGDAYYKITRDKFGRWLVDSPVRSIIKFELYENLVLGLEADAYQLEWNGSAYATTGPLIVVKDFTASPGSWSGIVGYQGWAFLPAASDDGKYEIIWMENVARFIEFTSTEDMGYTSPGQMAVTVNAWWDIKVPTASPVIVKDPRGLFTRALTGAKGKAVYDPKRDTYIIVECQTKAGWVQVTLTTNVSSGSSLTATVNTFGGSQQDVQDPDPTNAGISIFDFDNHFRRAKAGADALAIYDAVNDRYLFAESESQAGWVWVTLTSAMSSSATCTVGGYHGSQQDVQTPGTISVYPIAGISDSLKSGDKVLAFYSNVDDKYYCLAKPFTAMWGYTQSVWDKNGGDPCVSIKLVTGTPPRTSSTVSGSAFNCYLPSVNGRNPNVVAGRNICFMYDNYGDAIAMSDYMDDTIGTVKFMAINMTTPVGWGFMDTTENSSSNGGTGIDARRSFIRSPATVSLAGGLGGDGNSSNGYSHNHFISCLCGFHSSGATAGGGGPYEFFAWTPGAPSNGYTADGVSINMSSAPGGQNYTANQDPMYIHLPAIERLDNSL